MSDFFFCRSRERRERRDGEALQRRHAQVENNRIRLKYVSTLRFS
jgi:hypothetical protein